MCMIFPSKKSNITLCSLIIWVSTPFPCPYSTSAPSGYGADPPSLPPPAPASRGGSGRTEDTCLFLSHAGEEGVILSDQGREEALGAAVLQSRGAALSEFP